MAFHMDSMCLLVLCVDLMCVSACVYFSVFSALNFGPLFPQVKCILGLIIIADYFFFTLVCSFEEIVKTFVFFMC